MTPLLIMVAYLGLLVVLGLLSNRMLRGTSLDFFVASHSIGPFMLLMAVFGTAMTAFTLVGATGESYRFGIVTYAKLASWSGLIHSMCIYVVGVRLWAIGKRYGYVTQCQFFRDRFESPAIGYLLFAVIVLLLVPYLLIGLKGAGGVVAGLTSGALPGLFPDTDGAIPSWLTALVISVVVLVYVFAGGVRGTIWANTLQTVIFILTAVMAFFLIANALGGPAAAIQAVADSEEHSHKLARDGIPLGSFITYAFIPLSIAMFPHIFQNWLTARSAKTFKTVIMLHPVCMMLVWAPCVLIGLWATVAMLPGTEQLVVPPGSPRNAELALMVQGLTHPIVAGLLGAGILAAIMSSLDSQFMCVGTMFTNDIVARIVGPDRLHERAKIWWARGFIIAIVAVTYLLSLPDARWLFPFGVWVFSGFGALFPIVVAALYWKRTSRIGVLAALAVTITVWLILFYAADWGSQSLLTPQLVNDRLGGLSFPAWFYDVMPATWVFAGCLLTLVAVSLCTSPPSRATLHRFFPSLDDRLPSEAR
jgi:SSS family solute:Na+ symporter